MSNTCITEKTSELNFSQALTKLKEGLILRRANWNAKNQYVVLVKGASIQQGIDSHYGNNGETGYPVQDFFMIKSAQDTLVTWVPSVSDILAEDWEF